MAYIPNLTWAVADVDRLQLLARRSFFAHQIAKDMGRDPLEVQKFCDDNGIFVRTKKAVRS